MLAYEVVHNLHREEEKGVILKLQKVDFLFEVLESRGFGRTWIGWIKKIVEGGSFSGLLNGVESNTFKVSKGLRQGDPISPLLFNLVGDLLTKMLAKVAWSSKRSM